MLYFPSITEGFSPPSLASLYFADRYLVSIYPFITEKRPIKAIKHALELFPDKFVMIDSGVYSLVHKDSVMSNDALVAYTQKYLDIIKKLDFKGLIIEVDSQYLQQDYGTLEKLRRLYKSYGVADQVIYVWHMTDGFDGFFDMMSKYKRVAFSLKEAVVPIKSNEKKPKKKQYQNYVLTFIRKIKNITKNHHIHLLGTTVDWLAHLPHNWTCDSATWTSGLTWGYYFLENPFGFDFRKGRFSVSPSIEEKVDAAIPELMRIYRSAPRFSRRSKSRVDALRKMAIMMLSMIEWWESETLKRLGNFNKPYDPLDEVNYARK